MSFLTVDHQLVAYLIFFLVLVVKVVIMQVEFWVVSACFLAVIFWWNVQLEVP
jgi:hypothetical protein